MYYLLLIIDHLSVINLSFIALGLKFEEKVFKFMSPYCLSRLYDFFLFVQCEIDSSYW